jgi:hypothetical protein
MEHTENLPADAFQIRHFPKAFYDMANRARILTSQGPLV